MFQAGYDAKGVAGLGMRLSSEGRLPCTDVVRLTRHEYPAPSGFAELADFVSRSSALHQLV